MIHALILAGGSGTRLWPASRIAKPKPLLAFDSQHTPTGQTLLQATLERLTGLVPHDHTWIVTSLSQSELIADALPQFDTKHIWSEPTPRNTAASIGWAAVKLRRIDPDAAMIVLPADHLIKPDSIFCETLQCAGDIVAQSPEKLVTIGVKPTFPATSYGYIQRGETTPTSPKVGNYSTFNVLRFYEKPNRVLAESFCKSDVFYWNAGIFVWKAKTILDLLHRFEPDIGNLLDKIADALGTPEESIVTDESFQKMKSLSIDYAVMERAKNTVVVEATFDWNDVGTWTALDRLYADQKDHNGNLAVASQVLAIDSSNCTVRCDNPDHLVALVGMRDIVVIQTADATLIVAKDQEESVRRIIEELNKQNLSRWS